ncbi:monovalent cation/H+ antiporter subunit D [Roseomonas sp. NAR14]|uniref:Monovalent cation/H+ antiporter subunit D n=1 Tax=Roseomonas acroporae TaxID=2937791 RepID=A0A9X2BSE2_9PROT|nr:monovalent cation/H+ antiporter subunit D [Roseomonas acroporae]MCK8783027.1 monovalent cation/H+ antiporter subunit D [Roseomonas acroporae]
MRDWLAHLAIAPILLPLLAGATMVLIEGRRPVKVVIGLASTTAMLAIAVALAFLADAAPGAAPAIVYRLGDWPAAFGIVLVVDRLAAMLLALAAALGLAALVFSLAHWHRVGAHFHPILQFQLMGLNGAFLTGDLFNLFVFFEVMLAASYGLVLHGSGTARVRAGLHYIAINLAASLLFLLGASLIYGAAGTLNMADLAARVPGLAPDARTLLETGAAILGTAFLIKAGMWPVGFWLPTTYAAATAPAAALLSMLSKVGIYALLRLWLLLFGAQAGASAGFGGDWLLVGGLLTIAFGTISVLATQDLPRLAGACVLVSSGTLLAAIGSGQVAVTAGALFYIASAVPAIGAFFLLIDILERGREVGADVLAVTAEAFGEGDEEEATEGEAVGLAIPGTLALLGAAFLACALLLAGLPPLSGFLAKFAMLGPLLGRSGIAGGPVPLLSWLVLAALVLSGLATVIAMTRTGINLFWGSFEDHLPRMRLTEIAPVVGLLLLCVGLTVLAGPALRYAEAAAGAAHAPQDYVRAVLHEVPRRAAPGRAAPGRDGARAGPGPGGAAPGMPDGVPDGARSAGRLPEGGA